MRAVLRRPDFRLLFCGLFFSMTAESVLLLALAIWVKSLTGSSGMAGAVILALVAPVTLAPLVGFIVDRFRRRPFLIATNVFSALVLIPLLLVHGRDQVWLIFAVAGAYGLSFIAVSAALNGLIKTVVPDGLLNEANGALQTVKQGLRLFGPLLGAGLYSAFGGWAVTVLGMIGFLVAAFVISLLRVAETRPAHSELRWLTEVGAGGRQLFGNPALRRAVLGVGAAVVVFGLSESVFFAFVDEGLHRPPGFVGVLVSAQGVGGLLGGLTSARVLRRLGEIGSMALGVVLFAPLFLTGITPNLWLAFPTVMIAGAGLPYAIVGLNTLMQRTTPAELMGRTSAAVDALVSGPQALSIGAGALLVGVLDFRILLAGMTVTTLAAAAYLWQGRRLSDAAPELSAVTSAGEPAPDQVVGDGGPVRQAEPIG